MFPLALCEWLILSFLVIFQVMREVCANGCVDLDGAGSGSPVHKPELEKVKTPPSVTTHFLSQALMQIELTLTLTYIRIYLYLYSLIHTFGILF